MSNQTRKSRARVMAQSMAALAAGGCLLMGDAARAIITIDQPTDFYTQLDGSGSDLDPTPGVYRTDQDVVFNNGGLLNSNDDFSGSIPNSSAKPITLNIGGSLSFNGTSGIFAENRDNGGSGGNIKIGVGGDLTMNANTTISTRKLSAAGDTGHSGDITIDVGGSINLNTGSIITAGKFVQGPNGPTDKGPAGAISITAVGDIDVDGTVVAFSGLSGGGNVATQAPGGGKITIIAGVGNNPGDLTISDTGVVSSEGQDPGADLVHLQGCEVTINGLVESTGAGHALPANPPTSLNGGDHPAKSTAGVEVWADGGITIDNSGTHNGEINADLTDGNEKRSWIDLFSNGDIVIIGDPSSPFAVHATNAGNGATGGQVTIKSIEGAVIATGKVVNASASGSGFPDGGQIDVEALLNLQFTDGAAFVATGDFNPTGGLGNGGTIFARSFTGDLIWTAGIGDVRPDGTITLVRFDQIDTTGTIFQPSAIFLVDTTGGAPTLPDGVVLPDCDEETTGGNIPPPGAVPEPLSAGLAGASVLALAAYLLRRRPTTSRVIAGSGPF